jgi:hypothetical protein
MLVARWHHHPVAAQFFRLIPLKPAYFVNKKTSFAGVNLILAGFKTHFPWCHLSFGVNHSVCWFQDSF